MQSNRVVRRTALWLLAGIFLAGCGSTSSSIGALSAAVHDAAESDDVIVVCGSLYLVAAVREALLKFPDPTNDVVGFC